MTTQDHLIAVKSLVAGTMGAFLAAIGLTDAELIGTVFAACVVGSLRAPAVGRLRGILLFGAAMLITAKLAQSISPALAAWMPMFTVTQWRTLAAIMSGTMLYPTLNAMWSATPAVIGRLAKTTKGGPA